jgi:hypothetical protein
MKKIIIITEETGEYDTYQKKIISTWVINRKVDPDTAFRDHLLSEHKKAGLDVSLDRGGYLDYSKVKGNEDKKKLTNILKHWTIERFLEEILKGKKIEFIELEY